MKLISTYGTLTPSPNQEEVIRRVRNLDGTFSNKKIKYCHPIGYHFRYRHAVDDHNNLRHSSPSLEGVWRTHRWEMHVFSFFLAVTEVNAFLACRFFIWNKRTKKNPTLHQFRKQLAYQMIENKWRKVERGEITVRRKSKRIKITQSHTLESALVGAKKYFGDGKWYFSTTTKYPQFTCTQQNCKTRVRSFCSCSIGRWLCKTCHLEHCRSVWTSDESSD